MKNTIFKIIARFVSIVKWSVVFTSSLAFSGFIYANGFESLTHFDFPYISALEKTNVTQVMSLAAFETPIEAFSLNGNSVGDYGKPFSLYIPSLNKRLEIVPAIVNNNSFYSRPNNVHSLTRTEDGHSDTVLYSKSSWRTVTNPENIAKDSFLYVDTNREWRYVFMVEEVAIIDTNSEYILPEKDNSQLVFIIQKPTGEIVVIRSTYRTVLSIQQ